MTLRKKDYEILAGAISRAHESIPEQINATNAFKDGWHAALCTLTVALCHDLKQVSPNFDYLKFYDACNTPPGGTKI